MSHIHRVLDKAQRDGFVKRTTPASSEPLPARPSAVPPPAVDSATARPAPLPPPGPEAPPGEPSTARFGLHVPPASASAVPNPFVGTRVRTAEAGPLHPLLVATAPDSVVAEEYRSLRTRIAHAENGRQYRALMVTSPTAGDGKTITAANLALTMGQEFHKRVLLVDADLRKGRLHQLLGLPPSPGLCEVLTGEATLEEALVSLPGLHLTFLPAGAPSGLPAELLGSAEMRRTVDLLRTQFDRVIFDTPPVVALADVGVLAPMVDGVVMVVRAGRTARPAIDRALREVQPAPVLGLVLNDVENPAPQYQEYPEGAEPPRRLRFPVRRPQA